MVGRIIIGILYSLFQRELHRLHVTAVGTHHDLKLAGLADEPQVAVVELQLVGGDGEGHCPGLSLGQMDAAEVLQLLHGA